MSYSTFRPYSLKKTLYICTLPTYCSLVAAAVLLFGSELAEGFWKFYKIRNSNGYNGLFRGSKVTSLPESVVFPFYGKKYTSAYVSGLDWIPQLLSAFIYSALPVSLLLTISLLKQSYIQKPLFRSSRNCTDMRTIATVLDWYCTLRACLCYF